LPENWEGKNTGTVCSSATEEDTGKNFEELYEYKHEVDPNNPLSGVHLNDYLTSLSSPITLFPGYLMVTKAR